MGEFMRRVPRLRSVVLATVVGIIVFLGFRLFLFTTDDAYIAFRYVSNHMLGRGFVWNPRCFPSLDLLFHRLEVPLNPIDSDREHVDEAEVFGVLGEHRRKRA